MRNALRLCGCATVALAVGCGAWWDDDVLPFDGFDLPSARYEIEGDVDPVLRNDGSPQCRTKDDHVDAGAVIDQYIADHSQLVGEMRTGDDTFVLELTWEPIGEPFLGECHGNGPVNKRVGSAGPTYRDVSVFEASGSGNIGLYDWPAVNEPDEVDALISPCLDTPYDLFQDFSNRPVTGASGRRYGWQDFRFTAKKGSVSGTFGLTYDRTLIDESGNGVQIFCKTAVDFSGKAKKSMD